MGGAFGSFFVFLDNSTSFLGFFFCKKHNKTNYLYLHDINIRDTSQIYECIFMVAEQYFFITCGS